MEIRPYHTQDCEKTYRLFYNTVHNVNCNDYTQEQINVWANGLFDFKKWNQSFFQHNAQVAIKDNIIVGFGDMDQTGYLDRLFVHQNYQRQGIATAICNVLEQTFQGNVMTTHASITAKPFFLQRGYYVITKQQVIRNGIALTNYIMKKTI